MERCLSTFDNIVITIQVMNEEIVLASKLIQQKKYSNVKESCYRISSLLNLMLKINPQNHDVQSVVFVVLKVVEEIIANLSSIENKSTDYEPLQPSNLSQSENDINNTTYSTTDSSVITRIRFDDIIGNLEVKQALYENIILRFKLDTTSRMEMFRGIRELTGNILLYGPPGCGKTILIQAAATESEVQLLSFRPSDILSKYQGESEKFIRDLHKKVGHTRTILFFDEFDSIARSRDKAEDGSQSRRLLAELLLFMNQMKSGILQSTNKSSDIVIVAATNRLEDLDEAIIRRFETKIFVGTLRLEHRLELIVKLIQTVTYNISREEFGIIAEKTEGWSGSDIEMLCKEAAMIPIREHFQFHFHSKTTSNVTTLRNVNYDDFNMAFKSLINESN